MAIFKDNGTVRSDRSQWDRRRHRRLLQDAIRENIGDIISQEDIIGQSKEKKFKIPIRGIKEYQFIYGQNSDGATAGTGKEKRGQIVGRAAGQSQHGPGQAGNQPGEDMYETEITMDEIVSYLFDELNLPDMDQKKYGLIETVHRFKHLGYQRKSIPPRLAKKRTVVEKLKREQSLRRSQPEESLNDIPERIPFREEDLRYHRVREVTHRHANAVVICIMDTSGSMDETKKYLARSFYFLLYQFVCWRYEHVELVFIAHTTEAKEVSQWEFFHHSEVGGTAISSGYAKALEIIDRRYNPNVWNIYAFHCSDGDNWSEDNAKAIDLAQKLCTATNLFGYGEIACSQQWNSTIRRDFEQSVTASNFSIAVLRKKEDIWPAFKSILDKQITTGGDSP